ncbi:hypothetical protein A2U01_0000927 [Trifolium medium]|uniref:Uncharacterized protein n=1 Tax=Trifolium medium TaxID=97028 RepID=A0A392M0Q2_9FABA|nr:hypothetical protein [Trifolium medium]
MHGIEELTDIDDLPSNPVASSLSESDELADLPSSKLSKSSSLSDSPVDAHSSSSIAFVAENEFSTGSFLLPPTIEEGLDVKNSGKLKVECATGGKLYSWFFSGDLFHQCLQN